MASELIPTSDFSASSRYVEVLKPFSPSSLIKKKKKRSRENSEAEATTTLKRKHPAQATRYTLFETLFQSTRLKHVKPTVLLGVSGLSSLKIKTLKMNILYR